MSDWLPATTGTIIYADGGASTQLLVGHGLPRSLTPCCCCPSAGPEGPEQVRPFLENVTRGRGIPPERLDDVAEHYQHFGGVSPINGINRALIEQIEAELAGRGIDLPVYFGNRNWEPYVEDTVAADARRRDSACGGVHHVGLGRLLRLHAVRRGHRQGPRGGRGAGAGAGEAAPVLRPPAVRRDVRRRDRDAARRRCPTTCARSPAGVHRALDPAARPRSRCGHDLYSRQVGYASRLVAAAAGYADYDQVWQSRSGPPQRAVAGTRRRRPPCRAGRRRHQGGDRLPDRLRRRPHRGGVGPRPRAAPAGGSRRASRSRGRPRPTPNPASRGWPPT